MANEITKVTDKNNVDHPLRDEAAQTALTGILNGQSIDSFGDVESALEGKFSRSEQAVLGAKNLLPNKGTSTTADGITWTVNADGTVQANGTKDNNDNGFKTLDRNGDNYHLPSGRYVLSGNASSACMIMLQATRNGQLVQLGQVMGSDTEAVVDILSTDVLQCVLFVNAGQTVNNVIFYPMLRLASDTDDTYAPYAKTNRELTEDAEYKVGDSINITNSLWVGHLTGGSKELYCFIPLNKPVNKSVTGILFSDTVVNVRSNGDYLISNENLSNYTISNVNINSLGIFFLITKSDSSAFASFNNVPATIQPYSNNAKLTFT